MKKSPISIISPICFYFMSLGFTREAEDERERRSVGSGNLSMSSLVGIHFLLMPIICVMVMVNVRSISNFLRENDYLCMENNECNVSRINNG